MGYREIAALIAESKKTTPAKVFVQGRFEPGDFDGAGFQAFGDGSFRLLIGDYPAIESWLKMSKARIEFRHVEISARNSALPSADLRRFEARIEPGAFVREGARIGKGCVIMMGAIVNIGADVGAETMIDMNAVLGARTTVGRRCHIGAGAVLAGVLEPPSARPVRIGDDVLVGANAVVLEGVRVGRGSVVAAGAVVTRDVPGGVIVAGIPARVVKTVSDLEDKGKIAILPELRTIGRNEKSPGGGRRRRGR
jgi:2,3,4,5-tetrahydropyridine-2-carboxylate N-succinyltransferase/tetrahydrodipicolinate N-acetyltransferase